MSRLQRSVARVVLFSGESVCDSVCPISWTIRDITKFSWHHPIESKGRQAKFENAIAGCTNGDLSHPMFYLVTLAPPGE